jgi:hypothetical protein
LTQLCTETELQTAACSAIALNNRAALANALQTLCVVSHSVIQDARIFILHPSLPGFTVSCVPFMRDNIKMDSKEIGFEYLDCIHTIRVRSSEHCNESSGPIKCTEFVEQLMPAHSAIAPTTVPAATGCPALFI